MEEILRLRIKNSEAATIEVVPVEDGVEILVLRKGGKPKKYELHDERKKDNLEVLREFCSRQKEECTTKEEKGELKRFWEFYSPKMEDWNGAVDCSKLWSRWAETK